MAVPGRSLADGIASEEEHNFRRLPRHPSVCQEPPPSHCIGKSPPPVVRRRVNIRSGSEAARLAVWLGQQLHPGEAVLLVAPPGEACGTAALRAVQLLGALSRLAAVGLALGCCCMPPRDHARRKFCYAACGHGLPASSLWGDQGGGRLPGWADGLASCCRRAVSSRPARPAQGTGAQRRGPMSPESFGTTGLLLTIRVFGSLELSWKCFGAHEGRRQREWGSELGGVWVCEAAGWTGSPPECIAKQDEEAEPQGSRRPWCPVFVLAESNALTRGAPGAPAGLPQGVGGPGDGEVARSAGGRGNFPEVLLDVSRQMEGVSDSAHSEVVAVSSVLGPIRMRRTGEVAELRRCRPEDFAGHGYSVHHYIVSNPSVHALCYELLLPAPGGLQPPRRAAFIAVEVDWWQKVPSWPPPPPGSSWWTSVFNVATVARLVVLPEHRGQGAMQDLLLRLGLAFGRLGLPVRITTRNPTAHGSFLRCSGLLQYDGLGPREEGGPPARPGEVVGGQPRNHRKTRGAKQHMGWTHWFVASRSSGLLGRAASRRFP